MTVLQYFTKESEINDKMTFTKMTATATAVILKVGLIQYIHATSLSCDGSWFMSHVKAILYCSYWLKPQRLKHRKIKIRSTFLVDSFKSPFQVPTPFQHRSNLRANSVPPVDLRPWHPHARHIKPRHG